MNFQENLNPKTTVKTLDVSMPYVVVSKKALIKMFHYVDQCADEIGWLGTAHMNKKEIYVEDVYLFDQEVHSTTTEITPEGLASFCEEIMSQPDGMEIWNNLKVWGHSHVNMSTFASSQDDKQMEEFKNGGHEWFLRIIANKKGDLRCDLYHYEYGLIFNEISWEADYDEVENSIYRKINELSRQLEEYNKQIVLDTKDYIAEEIKQKVRKKHYGGYSNYSMKNNTLGFQKQSEGSGKSTEITKITDGTKKKESESEKSTTSYDVEDYFDDDDEVRKEFSVWELTDLAKCDTLEELNDELEGLGWFHIFTEKDMERISRVAVRTSMTYGRYDGDEYEFRY